jgi:hypothetical protein
MAPIITNLDQAYMILQSFLFVNGAGGLMRKKYIKLTTNGVSFDYYVETKSRNISIPRLPIKFNHVTGMFIQRGGQLELLDGAPSTVGNSGFTVHNNKLTNLVGGPSIVDGEYIILNNPLTSLDGLPTNCGAILLTYKEMPMLRLLGIKFTGNRGQFTNYLIDLQYNDVVANIFNSHAIKLKHGKSVKLAIWECQKDLIDNGYEKNASW